MNWIVLVQDRERWGELVNAVMYLFFTAHYLFSSQTLIPVMTLTHVYLHSYLT